ncbi:grasp-with-spasm system ATP-grasp peptide maturase [Aquimarina gracilis]|uniref:Grasp-with-spasm system ATP-grasp peptide maturase n=1 Tax=Aquimarina gracilis TaxID=874422 RepID=A0ABU6A171_9FLAO|nr:grasp-with-spasm system ATP-grasp peptide maturase [Aquimarina gracilis]MEB3347869.1 grasp-with-spasm system ATP-grasp peptide maturase [Aquimarina gracilis]
MILICKKYKEKNESYEEVVDWLSYNNAQFEFLSGRHHYEDGKDWSIELNNTKDNSSQDFSKYKSVWFRGFLQHNTHLSSIFDTVECSNNNVAELRWRLGQEISKTNTQIFNNFKNAFQLPNPKSTKVDKFSNLRLAKNLGLEIPPSIITNSKNDLKAFFRKHKEIITKPLYETLNFEEDDSFISFKTDKIEESEIYNLPDTFFPSFFQAYIEKDIELRAFYLEREFYTMAIFSQLDPMTKVDFRNYNEDNPNRKVPYLLPKEIEEKLKRLMKELNLNTGSIDLIKSPDKKHIFLEVNPTGQFGFVSKACNYYIEEKIAKTLIKHDS